jgi:predicted phosphodiesterase
VKKVLIVPDVHVPYHDKRAWKLMLKAAGVINPDAIIIQGDFADFYAVSAHDKDPNRAKNLEFEVDAANSALDELDALGAKLKLFVAGNHENRLERYLATRAPELFNMVEIPKLFKLKDRGWKYTPYKSSTEYGKLNVTHDCGYSGQNAVQKALDTFQHNVTTGHTHRMAYLVQGNARGEAHVSASFGWLGDKDQADYMHKVKANRDWALGFGIGYRTAAGVVHLQPVPIINYQVVVEGQLVKG